MKKTVLAVLLAVSLFACNNNNKSIPDVSDIKVDITWERFDRDFFSIDSNNILPGLDKLNNKYPVLTGIFLQNVLGLDSAATLPGVKLLITISGNLYDTVYTVFKNTT